MHLDSACNILRGLPCAILYIYVLPIHPSDLSRSYDYVPADKPCCPGERCCEYAERMEREYTAEREADEDNEDADVFEYDREPAISELTGVCRDILTAVEGLTTLLRDEFDYAD